MSNCVTLHASCSNRKSCDGPKHTSMLQDDDDDNDVDDDDGQGKGKVRGFI